MRNELEEGFFFFFLFLLRVCPGTEGESPALGMQEEINLPAVKPLPYSQTGAIQRPTPKLTPSASGRHLRQPEAVKLSRKHSNNTRAHAGSCRGQRPRRRASED